MGLLTSPFCALFRIFEEVAKQADDELNDEDGITADLVEANRMLEAGLISSQEFAGREAELMRRLVAIDERAGRRDGHGPS